MAYVMSIRAQTGGGSGSTINSAIETYEQNDPFNSGLQFTVGLPLGATILSGTLIVNYNEKILVRGADYDYTFDGVDTVTILFADDPTQYANGSVVFQLSYAYTT